MESKSVNAKKIWVQRLNAHQAGLVINRLPNAHVGPVNPNLPAFDLVRGVVIPPQPQQSQQEELEFLPLANVDVKVEISEGIAMVKITQEYQNPIRDEPQDAAEEPKGRPIDITYKFPKEADVVISKMTITVGDKTIEAKIEGEEKANQKFDDAIAGGHTAAMVKDARENVDLHQLDIGNIMPGESAKIVLQYICPLKVSFGAFVYSLPMKYFPKLKKLEEDSVIPFSFSAVIRSTDQLRQICHPKQFEIIETGLNQVTIQKLNANFFDIKKDIRILYKSVNADNSKFVFQRNVKLYPGKVAVMAQFLPNFSSGTVTADKIQVTTDEFDLMDDDDEDSKAQKLGFIFIVDRSGSMSGMRIELVKEALQMFMQSLPLQCLFKIISFGSSFQVMSIPGATKSMAKYEEKNSKYAIDQIEEFDANFGGTNLLNPTLAAFKDKLPEGFEKRVFILTDGYASDGKAVVEAILNHCKTDKMTKVFSFGMSDQCDTELVKKCAQNGNGAS